MDAALVSEIDLKVQSEGAYVSLADMMFVHMICFTADTLETWRDVSKSEVERWYDFSNVDG